MRCCRSGTPEPGRLAVTFVNRALGTGLFSGGVNVLLWVSYIVMLALYTQAFGSYTASFMPSASLTAARREPRVGPGAAPQPLRRGRLISCHTRATPAQLFASRDGIEHHQPAAHKRPLTSTFAVDRSVTRWGRNRHGRA